MPVSANTNFYEGGQDVRYKYLSANDVIYVADSFLTSAGLLQKYRGGMWSWGTNSIGALGLNDSGTGTNRSSPVQVGSLTNWYQISSGGSFSLSTKTDGTLWAWGNNDSGQLGLGNVTHRSSPVQVGALTNWATVSAGGSHSVAVQVDGTLWAWGQNSNGQLGLNDRTVRSSPVQVGALTNWATVSASSLNYILAIKTDGTLWAWGQNSNGALGLGDRNSRSSPVQVGSLTNWSQISAIRDFNVAIKTDGTLWAWGENNFGQLGLGDLTHRSSPVQVGSLTNWYTVARGTLRNVAAIRTDGTLWTWGTNGAGELGLNDITDRSSPVQVGALTNWLQVSAGSSYCLAIKTDGTLWAWGGNSEGQLGINDITNRSSPVQVGSLTNWNRVSSSSHSLAIRR